MAELREAIADGWEPSGLREEREGSTSFDVVASGTRREELLMSKDETQVVWKLRRVLSALDGQAALELLIGKLKESKSNIEFLLQVNKTTPSAGGRSTDDGS